MPSRREYWESGTACQMSPFHCPNGLSPTDERRMSSLKEHHEKFMCHSHPRTLRILIFENLCAAQLLLCRQELLTKRPGWEEVTARTGHGMRMREPRILYFQYHTSEKSHCTAGAFTS